MPDDVDVLKPWSIKAISNRVSDEIAAEARRSSLNTGQLIERMWAMWKAGGSPVHVPARANAPDFAMLLAAAGPFSKDNPMPRDVRSLLNEMARSYRGVKPGLATPRLANGAGIETGEGAHAE